MPYADPIRRAEYHKAYEDKRRVTKRADNKAYHALNRQRAREYKMKSEYGLTLADYNSLLAKQGFVCAICGLPFDPTPKNGAKVRKDDPVIDHNHATGVVRGILHSRCNTGIGLLQDSPVFLENAARYLRNSQ